MKMKVDLELVNRGQHETTSVQGSVEVPEEYFLTLVGACVPGRVFPAEERASVALSVFRSVQALLKRKK